MGIKFSRPKAYAIDVVTGEYLGETKVEIDLEKLRFDEIDFIVPAFTVSEPPPAVTAKQKAVWNGSVWTIVSDRRGEIWYNGFVPFKVVDLGDPAEVGLSETSPPEPAKVEPDPLEVEKTNLIAKLQEVTALGASYVALKQPVPKEFVDEQVALVTQIRDRSAQLEMKKVAGK